MKSVYTISAMKQDGSDFNAALSFDPGHAVFNGHFPGKPVLPGVLLIEIASKAACLITGKELVVREASVIKFMRMIDPRTNNAIMLSGTLMMDEEKYRMDLNFYSGETVFAKIKGLRLNLME